MFELVYVKFMKCFEVKIIICIREMFVIVSWLRIIFYFLISNFI